MANFLSRILYYTYPVVLFALAFLGWGSASLSQVHYTLPPLGGEFAYWKPTVLERSCEQKSRFSLVMKNACTAEQSSAATSDRYTNRSTGSVTQQTN